ncbi:MAG: cytochrome P450 [Actinobacteria bacterium]|nr:cytochrome P450 [Actinomycetota bacterium]
MDDYELFCAGRLADPYPLLADLREREPVHWSERLQAWIVTRYDDVLAALLDRRFANDRVSVNMKALPPDMREQYAQLGDHVSNWLGFTDPPKHTRLRGLLRTTFTPALAEAYRPAILAIVDELIDAMLGEREPDLVGGYAFPMPARVIFDILGIRDEDAGDFHRWSDDMAAFTGNIGPTLVEVAPRAYESYRALEEFIGTQVDERKRHPHEDLLTHLTQAEESGELESRVELTGLAVFTLVAGHETTASLLGNALKLVLEDDDLRAKLQAEPDVLPAAVEEFLRLEAPIQLSPRLAGEDILLRGATIRSGDAVILHIGAANHDPARFPEPGALDLDRSFTRHLSFAWGPHFCLGAPLSRVETAVALERVLERMPDMRLTGEPLQWRENMTMRALTALRVGC